MDERKVASRMVVVESSYYLWIEVFRPPKGWGGVLHRVLAAQRHKGNILYANIGTVNREDCLLYY